MLIILDGWGIAPPGKGNAIAAARPAFFESLLKRYPHTELAASGPAVGLPKGMDGNSEAGHLNLGAGRVVLQDNVRISNAIKDGTFFKNPALKAAFDTVRRKRSHLHLMGLLSGHQSPHANSDHLFALIDMARRERVRKVVLHLFTDGRDSPPVSAIDYMRKLETRLPAFARVATVMGRFFAMDRKKNWPRTEKAYNAIVLGRADRTAKSPSNAVLAAYNAGESDEYIKPTIITDGRGRPGPRVGDHDVIMFFNFRSDRTRQLTKPFVQKYFDGFTRRRTPADLHFVAMSDFGPDLGNVTTAFPSVDIKQSLPMALAGHRQIYIAETEKYAHVTFFFNGGYADPVAGEDRVLINSPDVRRYDETPAMSGPEITDVVVGDIRKGYHEFICVNFASPDMVAHTGNFEATVKAIRAVDASLKRIIGAVQRRKGVAIITADHGNAEELIGPGPEAINTKHSTYPVPFIVVGPPRDRRFSHVKSRPGGTLADVAPTILYLLNIPKPKEMTGRCLCPETE